MPFYKPKYSVVELIEWALQAFPNDDLNARTEQPRPMLHSLLGIRADAHRSDWMSHCRSLSSMKSSDGVRMLEKAHMESEDTFRP
jgi:hypothetical protein